MEEERRALQERDTDWEEPDAGQADPPGGTRRREVREVPGLLYSVEENPPWSLSILLGLQVIVMEEERRALQECHTDWEDPDAGQADPPGGARRREVPGLLYSVEENPPWSLSILLGLQVIVMEEERRALQERGASDCEDPDAGQADPPCGARRREHTRTGWGLLYSVEENSPWSLSILLGLQNFLTAQSALFATPILLSQPFCMDQDLEGLVDLIGTLMFVSGIATIMQTAVGIRLPILQGSTASLVVPTLAIMSQKHWQCPLTQAREQYGPGVNFTALGLPEVGSDDHKKMWQLRIREVQGAIIVASLVQMVVEFSGAIGFILRYVGPLAITPTITLIGLSLYPVVQTYAAQNWWIAVLTMVLIAIFSQFLKNVKVPCYTCTTKKGGTQTLRLPLFSLFSVLLGILLAWGVCAILTVTDVFPDDPNAWGYLARTDRSDGILAKSKWFRFPYPGQWGVPTVTAASTLGIIAGIISSMIESVGDYYACARLSGAPPPPSHAVNRGIGIEGLCSMLAGAWGTGNGTTSFSENVGSIGITKVGSRRVFLVSGVLLMVLGCLGKFAAIFAMVPGAVIGGLMVVTFGMVVATGLSNLQYVDLNSGRNTFILGTSLFFGLSMPLWLGRNTGAIDTGVVIVDQILHVLLSTSMFVGGLVGFVLDNTISGTDEERGIRKWRQRPSESSDMNSHRVYDLPHVQKYLHRVPLVRYIPFLPAVKVSKSSYSSDQEIC